MIFYAIINNRITCGKARIPYFILGKSPAGRRAATSLIRHIPASRFSLLGYDAHRRAAAGRQLQR